MRGTDRTRGSPTELEPNRQQGQVRIRKPAGGSFVIGGVSILLVAALARSTGMSTVGMVAVLGTVVSVVGLVFAEVLSRFR